MAIGDIETFGKITYITGKCMYARVFPYNRDLEGFEGAYKEHDGMYTVMLGVPKDSEAFKTIMSWNKNYEPKEGGSEKMPLDKGAEKGLMYFTFKRKHKFISKKGEVIEDFGGAPKVFMLTDADKETYEPFDASKLIGNGSTVTLKLDVYTAKPGRSTIRIEAVSVDNLVSITDENGVEVKAKGSSAFIDDELPF